MSNKFKHHAHHSLTIFYQNYSASLAVAGIVHLKVIVLVVSVSVETNDLFCTTFTVSDVAEVVPFATVVPFNPLLGVTVKYLP